MNCMSHPPFFFAFVLCTSGISGGGWREVEMFSGFRNGREKNRKKRPF